MTVCVANAIEEIPLNYVVYFNTSGDKGGAGGSFELIEFAREKSGVAFYRSACLS